MPAPADNRPCCCPQHMAVHPADKSLSTQQREQQLAAGVGFFRQKKKAYTDYWISLKKRFQIHISAVFNFLLAQSLFQSDTHSHSAILVLCHSLLFFRPFSCSSCISSRFPINLQFAPIGLFSLTHVPGGVPDCTHSLSSDFWGARGKNGTCHEELRPKSSHVIASNYIFQESKHQIKGKWRETTCWWAEVVTVSPSA